jgi:hypothetical protein
MVALVALIVGIDADAVAAGGSRSLHPGDMRRQSDGRQTDRREAHHARGEVQGQLQRGDAPGVLKAVAVQGGRTIAESALKTVGEPAQIRLTADRKSLRADGPSLRWKPSTPTGRRIRMRIIQ